MKDRIPETIYSQVEFHAYKDHVTAIMQIGKSATIGLRFNSPEEVLMFFNLVMEKAAETWPNNPFIKEYLSDD